MEIRSMLNQELVEFMELFKVKTVAFPSVITYSFGTYKGEIDPRNGLNYPHGYGVMEYANGDWIACNWVQGVINGCGIMCWINGTEFRGRFKQGEMYAGKIIHINGETYEGKFSNGLYNGIGLITYADKEEYYGEFYMGERQGYGICKYQNNEDEEVAIYEGNWKKDTFDGPGVLYTVNNLYIGPWDNGTQSQLGEIVNVCLM